MSTTQDSPISLSFLNLPDADRATFERVLSFFAARDKHFVITDDNADIIITTDDYSNVEEALNLQQSSLLLVVTDDKSCPHGDLTLQRPLLVTRVMRVMEQAAEQAKNPKELATADTSTPACSNPAVNTPAPTVPTPATPPPIPSTPQQTYKALVIDDNAAIRKQLEIELRTSGIPSQPAESGEQALELIKDGDFDLIFLDIMMPGIDGYETCGQIRSNPKFKKTPIIMLSGKTAPLDEVKGVIAGASTYLTKPIQHDQFQQVLQRITRWLNEFR